MNSFLQPSHHFPIRITPSPQVDLSQPHPPPRTSVVVAPPAPPPPPPVTVVTPTASYSAGAPSSSTPFHQMVNHQTPTAFYRNTYNNSNVNHHHHHQPPFQYLLMVLERPTLQHRWGLQLALTQGRVEVSRSRIHPQQGTATCRAAWYTHTPRSPSWWWQYTSSSCVDASIVLEQFMRTHPWKALSSATQGEQTMILNSLEEGDAIIAINGKVVAGPCTDMDPVLQVFQQSQRLHMLLVRRGTPLSSNVLSNRGVPMKVTVKKAPAVVTPTKSTTAKSSKAIVSSKSPRARIPFVLFRNPLFPDPNDSNLHLPFADDLEHEPDEGKRARLFIRPITDVQSWIHQRKRKWRESYHVYPLSEPKQDAQAERALEQRQQQHHVPADFWTPQGFVDAYDWLHKRKAQWRQSYSWQRAKRRRIQDDVENPQKVSPRRDFSTWLRVRKTQWRLARRQRQRVALWAASSSEPRDETEKDRSEAAPSAMRGTLLSTDVLVMDCLLREKEEKERQRMERPPLDISWLFDVELGCPDDVVAHCLRFIPAEEHGKLLALNRQTRSKLAQRDAVWRLLCPSHWNMPRRPRQPWHVLYWTKLQAERREARKRGDDLLSRALNIVAKGDHLSSLERIVRKAEKDNKFDVNYSSGVVCERNSLLNLAVIHERHKICRWLVEAKGADIESEDRGQFTPLLNAAWAGDRVLVRFLLAHGANREQVGMSHYTRPLAPLDFEGRTAAEWADFRGHTEIARLIRLGL